MTYDSLKLLDFNIYQTFPTLEEGSDYPMHNCEDCMKYVDISYPVYIDGKIGLPIDITALGPWECSHHYILLLNAVNMTTEKIYYGPFIN